MPAHYVEGHFRSRRRGLPSSAASPVRENNPFSFVWNSHEPGSIQVKEKRLAPRSAWVFVIAELVLIVILERGKLPFLSHALRYYLCIPLVWITVAITSLWGWYRGLDEKPGLNELAIQLAVAAGFMDLAALIAIGIFLGIGASPYSHQLPAFLGILLHVAAVLVGLESARAYLLWRWYPRAPVWAFVAITILFTALMIPSGASIRFDDFASLIFSTMTTLLPSLSLSLLLTYLVWIGGPWTAILYRYFPLTFEWLSPILPDLSQLESAFLRTLIPVAILLLINLVVNHQEKNAEEEQRGATRWIFVTLFCAGLLLLNSGSLGIRTYLVSGISMEPHLRAGDVVIVERSSPEDIHLGDVILFHQSTKQVVHRVIEISHTKGTLEFVTQGDANNRPDDPVAARDVAGKAIVRIPKIGWLSLQLKRIMGWLN